MSERPGSFDGLPDALREIAEVAGLEAAVQLAREYGGLKKKIPHRAVGARHWLVRCVGRRAADAICSHFSVRDGDGRPIGDFRLQIPLAGTDYLAEGQRRLARELVEGRLTVQSAARRHGFHERTAWRAVKRLRNPGSKEQPDLFGPPKDRV